MIWTSKRSERPCGAWLGDRLQPRENGILADGSNNPGPGNSIDEAKHRRDGLDIKPQAQLGIVVSVDLDDFGTIPTGSRSLPQSRVEDLARPAPRREEGHENGLFRLQDFRLEIRRADDSETRLGLDRVHILYCCVTSMCL